MQKNKEKVLVELELDVALQLQRISTSLIPEGNIGALYEGILDAAINLMSANMGSMQVFLPQPDELRLLANRGFHPESAAFWKCVRVDSTSSCGLALSSGARTILPDIETCDPAMGAGDLDAYRRSGIRAVQSTPLISRSGDLLGMISTHWREPHQPTELELRTFDVLARQAADLLDRARIEERARGLAAIVESNNDAIISMNLDGLITSWNKSAERIYGYLAEEVVGKPILILIPQERHGEESTILARIRRGERVDHYETIRRHKDGSLIDVSLTISPVRDVGDKIVGASKIARDVSERKRSEALVVTLVREAEHRARNVLAVVQAMVRLSQSETPEGLKAAIDGRIRALANVHTLFVQSRWAGASLRTLIEEELSPYLRGAGHTRVEGPTVLLSQDGAQTLALAVHELATNAAKYGALSVEEGCVDVEWSRTADGMLLMRWTESGGPPVCTPSRSGVGTRVVENMVRAVNGKLLVNWRAEGFQYEFALPVAGVEVTR